MNEQNNRLQPRLIHEELTEATKTAAQNWNNALAAVTAKRTELYAKATDLPRMAATGAHTATELLKMKNQIMEQMIELDLRELLIAKEAPSFTPRYAQDFEAYATEQEAKAQKRGEEITKAVSGLNLDAESVKGADAQIRQCYSSATTARSYIQKGAGRQGDALRKEELEKNIAAYFVM